MNGANKGNKALLKPIGLITADEVAYAGGVYSLNNSDYYLYTNQYYWTMTPFNFYVDNARVFSVFANGWLNYNSVEQEYGVRPVINLRSDVTLTGSGTETDPYTIVGAE